MNLGFVEISKLPITITQPGYYRFSEDFSFDEQIKAAISVYRTSNVTIDGCGHTLYLTSQKAIGILAEQFQFLTITNLSILYEHSEYNICAFLTGVNLRLINVDILSINRIYFDDIFNIYFDQVLLSHEEKKSEECQVYFRNSEGIYATNLNIQGGVDCTQMMLTQCYKLVKEAKRNNFKIFWY